MRPLATFYSFFSSLAFWRRSKPVPVIEPVLIADPTPSVPLPVDLALGRFEFIDVNEVEISSHLRNLSILEHEVRNMITIVDGNLDNVRPYSLATEVDQLHEYIQSHFSGENSFFALLGKSFSEKARSDMDLAKNESRDNVDSLVELFTVFRNTFHGDGFLGSDVRAEASYKTIRSNLKGIIEHLERFSQDNEVSFIGNAEHTKVCKQITHLLSALDVFSEERKIALRISDATETEHDVTVNIDKHLFRNAILNLISNSDKAAKKVDYLVQCSIKIDFDESGPDKVVIIIEDNGSGIPSELLPNIFDEGVSATLGETKSEIQGDNKGLGLAIVKKTIEAAGGTITVDSSTEVASHHTKFTITLPRVLDLDALIDLAKIKSNFEKKSTSKIPIIYMLEDEPCIREPIDYNLEKNFGIKMVPFSSADELFQKLREVGLDELPHVIIADKEVVGTINGDDAIRIIDGSNFRGIKYFFTSGNAKPSTFQLSSDGLVVSLGKPIKVKTLMESIKAHLIKVGVINE
jgi:signal transduction histidine kinase